METTRDALRSLIVHTLNDPVTLKHVSNLAKHTVSLLLEDAATRRQVVDLLRATALDPAAKTSILVLLEQLMRDEQTRRNLSQLLAYTFVQDPVKQTVTTTLGESVHDVLSRVDIQNHAKQFVGTVVKDQTVQAQSGDAIWSTFMYAVTPGWLSWIWGSNDHPAVPASVEKVVVVEGTPHEGFDDDVASSKKVEEERAKDVVVVTRTVPAAPHASAESEEQAGGEKKKPLVKRMTTKRTLPRRKATTVSSAPPAMQSEEDPKRAKESAEEFSEAYEQRHWNGTGSGFL